MNKKSTARLNNHGYVRGGSNSCLSADNAECNNSGVEQQGPRLITKRKEVSGIEASCTKRSANNSGKKHKHDEQKEALPGRTCNRQTMLLNFEDRKQVGTSRFSTPKRQIVPARKILTMKGNWINASAEKQEQNGDDLNGRKIENQKLVDLFCMEDGNVVEPNDRRSESSSDMNANVGHITRPKRIKTLDIVSADVNCAIRRQCSGKQFSDPYQSKTSAEKQEHNGEELNGRMIENHNRVNLSCKEDGNVMELNDRRSEFSSDMNANVGHITRPTRIKTSDNVSLDVNCAIRRQCSGKQFSDPSQSKTSVEKQECNGEEQKARMIENKNLFDLSCKGDRNVMEPCDRRTESSSDMNANVGHITRPKRIKTLDSVSADLNGAVQRQCSGKQIFDPFQSKSSQRPALASHGLVDKKIGTGKKVPLKKQSVAGTQYQDTSVERLLREVTNEKLWHNHDDNELQRVPGKFESVEEYVEVFEPLLFEECRAQLYRTWQELIEVGSSDAHSHVMVQVKEVERQEKGWFDVVVLPESKTKWAFKDGDVAVLSSARPGSAQSRENVDLSNVDCEEPEVICRVVGTVRRHIPVDVRDPYGATLHFYVGDSLASSSSNNDHILRKLKPREIWFLTALGSIATTQREYVALYAFQRLNSQMQNVILQPSPKHFPKYEEQTPTIPECMTPKFIEHLQRNFNGPQLAAIQWAATHTATGTSKGVAKKQDSWPFTLVQGPPGTGKTLTVWGLLNVIHLVQYQHYYTALLKKLAPESYKQNERNNDLPAGSIDDFIQNMDQHLFSILPKLCPKPRMLVCAPSNAATDELVVRVLNRGFIDGENKVYRPDVARVGADSQSSAVAAVSVERKTELCLLMSAQEIYGNFRKLKKDETNLSYQIGILQRQLNVATVGRGSQGSVVVHPNVCMTRDQNHDALLQNLAAVLESRDKVRAEMSRLFILKGKFRPGSGFNLEEARASLEASFANDAEIVFTTLSSSGRKLFSRLTHGFDMVVIDEAAQASEVGILPPLSLGAKRCVLVGDPQQLPATVISKAAGTLLYSRSLFERFQQAGCPTMLLSVQYRMHPQIRDFPSRYFYKGRLTDSESVATAPDEKYYQDTLLRPYIFYDIRYGRESHRGGSNSYQNVHEAQFCRILYGHFQETVRSLGLSKVTVGIITPYKLQQKCLEREFRGVLDSEGGSDLLINTIDAFQGQERDVIIMSCVRASSLGVGFVADIRRMNVALTRGKRALWVVGNANALSQSDDWEALIADAKSRNSFMGMDSLPKNLQIPQGSYYNRFPGKITHHEGSRTRL